MASNPLSQRKAQLDKKERDHLENVVTEMRERVEDNVKFQLKQEGLDEKPGESDPLDTDTQRLAEAINLEAVDGESWSEAFNQYVTGVGYTIVNRLAALRCMEVRDFIDEEVTVFKNNGLTPAAETLVHEEFLLEDEAIIQAYHDVCDRLAEDIEILFDRETPYSQVDPDVNTFGKLCGMLDDVPDAVWRADDVLGWIYEYYNRPVVESLDAKRILEPEDIGPANQFYTPHWVVRMLADNSLGKLYLEATDDTEKAVDRNLSLTERKERSISPEDSPDLSSLCTYLIPDESEQAATSFDDPSEIRVIDPACGSGHFLLYAFDILERIWWAERPDLDRSKIPAKILEENLYGIDLDLRSCQLSAFNLYLKARSRAEQEGNNNFNLPNLGIVCADARVAETESALEIIDEITEEDSQVRDSIESVMDDFQNIEALGSLLNVKEEIEDDFLQEQTTIFDSFDGTHTLSAFMEALHEAVEERTSGSFAAQNLRSFLQLLVVLTQNYDVALMNPPYGSGGRMPDDVQTYVEDHYEYTSEYYINFFEVCDRLVKENGRIGMLIPRSFMFQRSFEDFREDFVGSRGSFDFLAEFGNGILDNATVRTVGTVVRSEPQTKQSGKFIRLHDIEKSDKERAFLQASFSDPIDDGVRRLFVRELSEFKLIPGMPLSYWVPENLRQIYDTDTHLDAERGDVEGQSFGEVVSGLCTGDDGRFVRQFWEAGGDGNWVPFAKGGSDAWLLPRVEYMVNWSVREMESQPGARVQNSDYYFSEGLSYTVAKETGRRFGYLHDSSIFSNKGSVLIPNRSIWNALSYANSHLFTYLMLAQTPERMWQVGAVSKVPWHDELETVKKMETLSQEAVSHLISLRQYDFTSPHYTGPVLLAMLGIEESLELHDHPHRELRAKLNIDTPEAEITPEKPIQKIGVAATKHVESINAKLQSCADTIDEEVFESFDIPSDDRETILQEIKLRTSENPTERVDYDPDSITEPGDNFEQMVKDLLLHLTLRIVTEDEDGIVPISKAGEERTLLDRIEEEFERLFGQHADDRLAEVDQILGSKTPDQEAYPNLHAWLSDDVFEYHVQRFKRTPIMWKLTTNRLVSDPEGEGFACLVDYHQLDGSLFDSLQNRYLEPRKALLRERRNVANRRRNDESLTASEQAEAVDEYARCESGLEQISIFEDRMADLAQPTTREWSKEDRELAATMAEQVAEFRKRTKSRLETLETLADLKDVEMGGLFSPSFYETVQKNQEEWLDALEDLEEAFKTYTKDNSAPVKPHLYDLFAYYEDLIGSAHYASNGILFMTYYFDKFEDASQAQIGESDISERQRLLSKLASDLDEYEELANKIADGCDEMISKIPSEWSERALSEIMTDGYQPNRKHGVVINISPLVEAEIVPETVDKEVI
jgi:hypothetical protein